MENKNITSAFRVSIIYLLFSASWIFLSDYILLVVIDDVYQYRYTSTIKGLFFIVISALIIYYLVKREVSLIKKAEDNIVQLENFDLLTGVHNRSSFDQELNRIYSQEIEASILITDINGLKLINEFYSSEYGDKLLSSYAEILKDSLSDETFIARVGGDEFCVIFYHTKKKHIENMIEKIRKNLDYNIFKDIELTVAMGFSTTSDSKNIYSTLSYAEDSMLKNKLLLVKSASSSLVKSLKTSLFERSDETEQHASRMEKLCAQLGYKLDLKTNDINDLKLFAILHDIGKIGIDDSILKKPGKLTKVEYNKMKQHPIIGYKIASGVPQLEAISYYILTHHERWDGTGYPKELKGEETPLLSRILAVVDAYDAMSNDRIYRKALSEEKTIQELIDNRGKQFDPAIVDVFLDIIR
ncbi:MAG: diguanylate cyclase [Candidatus Izimaplasma sp.]|nr:diguanylate cyclase [Candidatus Izimaplasma bacterium]